MAGKLNDAQKAQAMRKILSDFEQAQPGRKNRAWIWALDGKDLPPVALAMLYDFVAKEFSIAPACAWAVPRYPGDSVLIVNMRLGAEIGGSVRIQAYDGNFKVGSFLPGEIQSHPGDTPKVWPEISEWTESAENAQRSFDLYVSQAISAGWEVVPKK